MVSKKEEKKSTDAEKKEEAAKEQQEEQQEDKKIDYTKTEAYKVWKDGKYDHYYEILYHFSRYFPSSPSSYLFQLDRMFKLAEKKVEILRLFIGEEDPKKLTKFLIEEFEECDGEEFIGTPAYLIEMLGSLGSSADLELAVPYLSQRLLNASIWNYWLTDKEEDFYDSFRYVRRSIVWALGMLGVGQANSPLIKEHAIPALVRILKGDCPNKYLAAWSLGMIGSKEVIPLLRKARYDMLFGDCGLPDPRTGGLYKAATFALQRLGVPVDDVSFLAGEFKKEGGDFESLGFDWWYWYVQLAEELIPELLPLVEQKEDKKLRRNTAVVLVFIAHSKQLPIPQLYRLFQQEPSFQEEVIDWVVSDDYWDFYEEFGGEDAFPSIPMSLLKGGAEQNN